MKPWIEVARYRSSDGLVHVTFVQENEASEEGNARLKFCRAIRVESAANDDTITCLVCLSHLGA